MIPWKKYSFSFFFRGSSMDITESIEAYLNEKRILGVLSESTVRSRRYELNRFAKFCYKKGIKLTFQIKKNTVIEYLSSLKVLKITQTTIMHVITTYMKYLLENEAVIKNYAAELSKPKTPYPEADYLNLTEVENLFQTELETATPKTVARNLLLMNLLFTLCLRAGEAIGLKINDVGIDSKQIWVKRKGGKIMKLPLNNELINHFKNWYEVRRTYQGSDSEFVFLSSHGKPLTNRQAGYIVSNALNRAKIEKRKNGCHILRHSGATFRLKRGEDIRIIQYLLGHKTLHTTEKYLHFNEDELKKMVEKSNIFLP
jgi:site-specific recombinase XerD